MDATGTISLPAERARLRLNVNHAGAAMHLDDWHEVMASRLGRSEIVHTGVGDVRCEIATRPVGSLSLADNASTPFEFQRLDRHIRADERGLLGIALHMRGNAFREQDDRRVIVKPGTISVIDSSRPFVATYESSHRTLGFGIERERLERVFGSSKRFTMLPIDETLGSAPIAAFLTSLFENANRLSPEVAAEMAEVGFELVMSGLARRLAMEPAVPQSAALLLHRAQGFIMANLADPALNPATVATALGISLRHLQALFHRRQTTPSDWMWRRRLARARERLASPGFATVSVAEVAYGCGFSDQGHFSRRFKAEFGLSPRDWRQTSLLSAADAGAQ